MTSMLNLGDVLQLVGDAFNDGAFAQQEFVAQGHEAVLHIGLETGDELNALLEQLLEHRLRQVTLVTEQLAKQSPRQLGQQLDIGAMRGRQTATEQFTAVIDHQMEFEAETPTARATSARRQSRKDLVLLNAPIIADGDEGRVNEADAGAVSKQAEQIGAEQREYARGQLDKACVADQVGKLSAQMLLDVLRVVRLETAILALVEVDQDGHDFAVAQVSGSVSLSLSSAEPLRFPRRRDLLTEIIDMAEQFQ